LIISSSSTNYNSEVTSPPCLFLIDRSNIMQVYEKMGFDD